MFIINDFVFFLKIDSINLFKLCYYIKESNIVYKVFVGCIIIFFLFIFVFFLMMWWFLLFVILNLCKVINSILKCF